MRLLGQYQVLQELSAGKSFLAKHSSGSMHVLKLLPPDCLLEAQLNPTVADRLRRIREIPMTNVAHLRGVQREGENVFLIWDFVDAQPLTVQITDTQCDTEQATSILREFIQTVENFHSTGLVHGAIHRGNVLLDQTGNIRLIDVSPLLFLDPARDERAVVMLCEEIATEREDQEMLSMIRAAKRSARPMQELSRRLSFLGVETAQPTGLPRNYVRRSALIAALAVALTGVAIAVGVARMVERRSVAPLAPPRVGR